MKKIFTHVVLAAIIMTSFSSCATVFGGRVTEAQRTPPRPGEPSRQIRAVALIANLLLFWPGAVVDFATGAIYKPEGNGITTKTPVEVKAAATVKE